MQLRTLVAAATITLSLAAGPCLAVPLFFDDFESGALGDWTPKASLSWATVVVDPTNAANKVLSFTGLNAAGDIFTTAAFSSPLPFTLSFDYRGGSGGFVGWSDGFPGNHVWLAGNAGYPGILTALINDGLWRHYEIAFSSPSAIHLMFEDFSGATSDAYFDNVRLEAVPEPGTLLLIGSGLTGLALRRRRRG